MNHLKNHQWLAWSGMRRRTVGWAIRCAFLLFVCSAPPALAQPHEQQFGDYVVRASTTSALSLPTVVREQHRIPSTGQHAVLNVIVQDRGDRGLVNGRASIVVRAHNLMGNPTSIEMREVVENGFVSYLGVYEFLPREVLDFTVTVTPAGSTRELVLKFRDRLGRS